MEAIIFIFSAVAFLGGIATGMYVQYKVQNEHIESLERRLKLYEHQYEDDGYEAY